MATSERGGAQLAAGATWKGTAGATRAPGDRIEAREKRTDANRLKSDEKMKTGPASMCLLGERKASTSGVGSVRASVGSGVGTQGGRLAEHQAHDWIPQISSAWAPASPSRTQQAASLFLTR